jgi:tRNA-splicing ligase RtcB
MVPVGQDEHNSQRLSHKAHRNTTKLLDNANKELRQGWERIVAKSPVIETLAKDSDSKLYRQVGSLGGGNHFIELCIDENNDVWAVLHSGSRGPGNMIGRHFIATAKKEMERHFISLPDRDLSYLVDGSEQYENYVEAVEWAQGYAMQNRVVMMELVLTALRSTLPAFTITQEAINCHHNYVSTEHHFGANVHVTRKGAVRARVGDLGIIPGSMGAKSFIVRGLGNADSFCSCSHGAGRDMSHSEAKRVLTLADHEKSTAGVECRKDIGVIDESPKAYKDIDAVMKAQEDLVEIVHTLKQVVCVKG